MRSMRFSNTQHPFTAKLETNQTNVFINSFIPTTSKNPNSFMVASFPESILAFQQFQTQIHISVTSKESLLKKYVYFLIFIL